MCDNAETREFIVDSGKNKEHLEENKDLHIERKRSGSDSVLKKSPKGDRKYEYIHEPNRQSNDADIALMLLRYYGFL